MRKKLYKVALYGAIILTTLLCTTAFGCKKKVNGIAENPISNTDEAEVYLLKDPDSESPVYLDKDGNVIELAKETKDDSGKGVSITLKDGSTAVVKEKDTSVKLEEKKELEKPNETPKSFVSSQAKKEEKTSEKTKQKDNATKNQKAGEDTSQNSNKKADLIPGVNAPKETTKTTTKTPAPSKIESSNTVEVAYTESPASGIMYGAFLGSNDSQLIYEKAGTEYLTVKESNGSDARITGAQQVNILAETSNGWYKIEKMSLLGPISKDNITGYVPKSSLISEDDRKLALADAKEQTKTAEEELKRNEKSSEKANEQKGEDKKTSSEEITSGLPIKAPENEKTENLPKEEEKASESPIPSPEIIEQLNEERKQQVEAENQKMLEEGNHFSISASSNTGIFDAINVYREENGLGTYEWGSENEGICETRALEQTEYVFNQYGSIAHDYGTPVDTLENLCVGLDVMDAWKSSGGHNAALLREDLTKCVVYTGYYDGNEGVTVALFW